MNRPLFIRRWFALPLLLGLLSLAGPLAAVDVPNRNPPAQERAIREARAAISSADWAQAVSLLQAHVQAHADDADAHNLLGYSLRKLGHFDASHAAYQRALGIDPAHRGAHEYLGELMLTLGRREQALWHLKRLEALCPAPCQEHERLKQALDEPTGRTPRGWTPYQ